MNVGIVGCGLIGRKRAASLNGSNLVACTDIDATSASMLSSQYDGCQKVDCWERLVEREDIGLVVVATAHDTLAEITKAALRNGKHVLVEKPGAIGSTQLESVIEAERQSGRHVHVGFNHRYHRAFRKAFELVRTGELGPLMFIRARYGHGGRPGYESEWRASRMRSGGGELVDQGIHLVDLARCFLGDFTDVQGYAETFFWNMEVEDNGFMMLRTPNRQVAFLQASWTEWKNLFSFEIYGRQGKLEISGLGGSYGIERLAWYRMLPEMGPPETTVWEFPMADDSWKLEMAEFLEDIKINRRPASDLTAAAAALRVIEKVYQASGR